MKPLDRLLPTEPCRTESGGSLNYLGEDTTEQLELMRSAFRVIRTVREKHACRRCDRIVQAPAPSRPVERNIAGPGLLARVLNFKYAEHTPLYRQSEIYGRQGVAEPLTVVGLSGCMLQTAVTAGRDASELCAG